MSSKEINRLRKEGRLEEARALTAQVLREEPDNIWNKRAASWVFYTDLKEYAESGAFDDFHATLKKIKDLQLPADDKMIFDKCAYQIGKFVFSLCREGGIDYGKIDAILDEIQEFHFTKPSEAYSILFKSFHQARTGWNRYLEFAEWWGFKNFRKEDYKGEEREGRKYTPIAERAFIAYSKRLLEGFPIGRDGQIKVYETEKIQSFLPVLEAAIQEHPGLIWLQHNKVKLLLTLEGRENVVPFFIPLARKKRNDVWVWSLMAELNPDDKELQLACYCKALTLKTSPEFLVKVRQSLASLLVEKKLYNEARTEIDLAIEARTNQQWKITQELRTWTNANWYSTAIRYNDNAALYKLHASKAEEIIFDDLTEEIVAVEFVNETKKLITFVKNKEKSGYFSYANHLSKPCIGELLAVRFIEGTQGPRYDVLSIRRADPGTQCEAIMDFEGTLVIKGSNAFGFVGDVFIGPDMVKDHDLQNGQLLRGKAILSFNKKRSEWGCKGIEIIE